MSKCAFNQLYAWSPRLRLRRPTSVLVIKCTTLPTCSENGCSSRKCIFQLSKLLSILPISGKLKKKHFSAVEKILNVFDMFVAFRIQIFLRICESSKHSFINGKSISTFKTKLLFIPFKSSKVKNLIEALTSVASKI
jgi:hypothetical protein